MMQRSSSSDISDLNLIASPGICPPCPEHSLPACTTEPAPHPETCATEAPFSYICLAQVRTNMSIALTECHTHELLTVRTIRFNRFAHHNRPDLICRATKPASMLFPVTQPIVKGSRFTSDAGKWSSRQLF